MPVKKSPKKKGSKKELSLSGSFPRHNMVPVHEILSVEEGNAIVDRFRTPIDRMPKILKEDRGLLTNPKYRAILEAKEDVAGRIVRIRRSSQTSGEALTYRVIVEEKGD